MAVTAVRLGVLDFGFRPPGSAAATTIRDTCRLAALAESLGFSRFWLAEHHEPMFAWAAPEVVLPLVAEATRSIRIGIAGFLLHFYSPLKIAELSSLFEALYPNRIDIGLAAGLSEEITRSALSPGFTIEKARDSQMFGSKAVETVDYLRGRFPVGHRFKDGPTPVGTPAPTVWLMGSGRGKGGMILAAKEGAGYSYSLFHVSDCDQGPATICEYYDTFKCSAELQEPSANLAVTAICGESEAECRRRAAWLQATGFAIPVNV